MEGKSRDAVARRISPRNTAYGKHFAVLERGVCRSPHSRSAPWCLGILRGTWGHVPTPPTTLDAHAMGPSKGPTFSSHSSGRDVI